MFGIDAQTLVQMGIHFLNIAILAYVLRRLLYKPVTEFLKKREERIKGEIDFAEQEKSKAIELKLKYEQMVKDINDEKYEILEAARKLAADKSKESDAAAKVEAEAIKSRAFKEIEMAQENAKDEVKKAVIDVSALMVSKFVARTMDDETQEQLFNETMAELEGIAWHN
jgi:F-type H+-transporting ATPase subunit b